MLMLALIDDIDDLLSKPTMRQRLAKAMGSEIIDMLVKPTVKESSLAEKFKSKQGVVIREYCPNLTKSRCMRQRGGRKGACGMVFFFFLVFAFIFIYLQCLPSLFLVAPDYHPICLCSPLAYLLCVDFVLIF